MSTVLAFNSLSGEIDPIAKSFESQFNFNVISSDFDENTMKLIADNNLQAIYLPLSELHDSSIIDYILSGAKNIPIIVATDSLTELVLRYHSHKNIFFLENNLSAHAINSKLNAIIPTSKDKVLKVILDKQQIQVIIDATVETMQMMAHIKKIVVGEATAFDASILSDIDISGYAHLQSLSLKGVFTVSFPEKTFLKVVGNMLSCKYDQINPDIHDAANELNNIIYGQIKKQMTSMGYKLSLVTPLYLLDKQKLNELLTKGPTVYIPFDSELGKFYIFVSLHNN